MLDVQHYIESGILEEYALGVLSADERAEVERVAQQEPAVGRELAAVISSLDAYAEAHALAPPAGLRERVLGAWENSIRETGPAAAPAAPVTPVVPATPVAAAPRMSVAPAEPAAPATTEGGAVVRQLPAVRLIAVT